MRTLNIRKFSDTAAADEYVGGRGELCKVQEGGSEPSLRLHDGETAGGFEVSCDCSQADCSDACKQYVDDAVRNIVVGGAPAVIGIVLAQEGGGAGVWQRVDINGQPIEVPAEYFDYHPIYRAIHRVTIDGQVMQEHKKFWFKAMEIQDGPYQGKIARMISPYKVDETWKAFPSFMKNGKEIDTWWCGTYQASKENDGKDKLCSKPGVKPETHHDLTVFHTWAVNRGSGWDIWNIYQLAEIQLLALIEAGTSDTQSFYGQGRVSQDRETLFAEVDAEDVATATWRGHVGLWGNIWQGVYGLGTDTSGKVRIWPNTGDGQYQQSTVDCPTGGGSLPTSIESLQDATGTNYDFNEIFFPKTTTTVLQGSIPDSFWGWGNGVQAILYMGENAHGGAYSGLFSLAMNASSSVGSRMDFGTRLCKTPDSAA